MANVIGSGSWSLNHFVLVKTCIPGDEKHARTPAFAHPEKNVMFQKQTSVRDSLKRNITVLHSRLVLCCCQHRDFFQSANSFIAEDVSPILRWPLAHGLTILFYGQGFQKQCPSFSLVSHHNQPIVAVISGLGWWFGFLGSPYERDC